MVCKWPSILLILFQLSIEPRIHWLFVLLDLNKLNHDDLIHDNYVLVNIELSLGIVRFPINQLFGRLFLVGKGNLALNNR
jgi:hypothetical protein